MPGPGSANPGPSFPPEETASARRNSRKAKKKRRDLMIPPLIPSAPKGSLFGLSLDVIGTSRSVRCFTTLAACLSGKSAIL